MRKVLVGLALLVVVLVVGVGVLGFYREWWSFSTSRDAESGGTEVHFQIDQNKLKSDTQKAKQQISGPAGQAKEKAEGN